MSAPVRSLALPQVETRVDLVKRYVAPLADALLLLRNTAIDAVQALDPSPPPQNMNHPVIFRSADGEGRGIYPAPSSAHLGGFDWQSVCLQVGVQKDRNRDINDRSTAMDVAMLIVRACITCDEPATLVDCFQRIEQATAMFAEQGQQRRAESQHIREEAERVERETTSTLIEQHAEAFSRLEAILAAEVLAGEKERY